MTHLDCIQPLGDKVIVLQDKEPEKTAGGLYIPVKGNEKPLSGVVVACGPGYRHADKTIPLTVKPGDRVQFEAVTFQEVQHNGKEHLLMRESKIVLIEG